mgnify:CR=1 FL=1|tara:strand:- start:653 stop:1312 length:660 start_codon:yes stop_codon:yes gene_type:complete
MGFNYAKYKAAAMGSPLNKNGFGPKEQEKTTTGDSGSLREVIEDVRTKGADLIGKIHKGFDKPLVKNLQGMGKTADSMTEPPNTVQNVGRLGKMGIQLQYGLTPTVFGKLGGQLLENIIRPGKQSQQYTTQISESLNKAKEELKSENENSPVPKKKELTPFEKAFDKARKEGKDTFMFEGKEYGTALKGESKIYKADYQKGTNKFNYVGPDGKITEFTN